MLGTKLDSKEEATVTWLKQESQKSKQIKNKEDGGQVLKLLVEADQASSSRPLAIPSGEEGQYS